jgi:ABC-type transport system involved in cytochrome bd biosynthesis fused ATPase/permease subunit
MSIFNEFFGALRNIWSKLKDDISKVFAFLKTIAPFIIILAAVILSGGTAWPLFAGYTVSGMTAALLLMGASFVLLPSEWEAAISSVATELATVATDVIKAAAPILTAAGGVIGTAIGAGIGGLFSGSGVGGILTVLGVAGLSYFLLTRKKTVVEKPHSSEVKHASV